MPVERFLVRDRPLFQFMLMAEGSILFNYKGEEYQSLSAASITVHVLNLVHDRPSPSHDYLHPLTSSLNSLSRSSSMTVEKLRFDTSPVLLSFWSIDIFINKLTNLLGQIRIQDKFDLLGLYGAGHSI
ncbi:hypothetical protein EDD85DRAFT_961956 [Armillaria nabsnona]|nr:hypothetical protein EDD85DRAFT_961956 [Armillaria nabsnona]